MDKFFRTIDFKKGGGSKPTSLILPFCFLLEQVLRSVASEVYHDVFYHYCRVIWRESESMNSVQC